MEIYSIDRSDSVNVRAVSKAYDLSLITAKPPDLEGHSTMLKSCQIEPHAKGMFLRLADYKPSAIGCLDLLLLVQRLSLDTERLCLVRACGPFMCTGHA